MGVEGDTFSFRHAQALPKGSSHSVFACVLAVLRGYILFATANPFFLPVCKQICSNWGGDYPGPGISVGDRPGRMAKCRWGPPSSFNPSPGLVYLLATAGGRVLVFSVSLGRDWGGGLQSGGTDRQMEGALCGITVRDTNFTLARPSGSIWKETDWLTDRSSYGSRNNQHRTSSNLEMLRSAGEQQGFSRSCLLLVYGWMW